MQGKTGKRRHGLWKWGIPLLVVLLLALSPIGEGTTGLAEGQVFPPLPVKPQVPTLPGNLSMSPNQTYKEVFNNCDAQISKNTPASGTCRSAEPPLNAGDCLMNSPACLDSTSSVTHLIAYPGRPKILDRAGSTVVIKNEAFAFSALIMARDQATLEKTLKNIEIQALVGGQWTSRRSLAKGDYSTLTNLRHYYFSDCGKALATFKKEFALFEKLDTLAHAAVSVSLPATGPRPFPESLIEAVPGPSHGDVSTLSPGNEELLQEMADQAMKKAVGDLEAAAQQPSCPDKPLPYFWTLVFVRYTPELGDTRVRLLAKTMGNREVALTDVFKVYSAVAAGFDLPARDGNRDYTFQVYAAGELSLAANAATLVYRERDAAAEHRSAATLASSSTTATINGRLVKQVTASGRLPFTRSFWDETTQRDVVQTVTQPGDASPLVISGGATVTTRMEIRTGNETFATTDGNFTMPSPLTFALFGDSFASGQGSPFLSSSEGPWLSDDCHRSRLSGQYRAINRFIKNLNKATDYLFIACEGATIQDVYRQAQKEDHNPDGTTSGTVKQNKPQIDLVKDWLDANRYSHLNVAVMGIGGNNVGFANAIKKSLVGISELVVDAWFTGTNDPALRAIVDAGFARINGSGEGSYRQLDAALKNTLRVTDVILFGYPDITHDASGAICHTDCSEPPPEIPVPNIIPHSINAAEMAYGDTILTRLTAAVRSAGNLPGWHYVDIFNATHNHGGICTCQNIYFTTWTVATTPTRISSACKKGVGAIPNGGSCSFHPNPLGYEQYIAPILQQLNALHGN